MNKLKLFGFTLLILTLTPRIVNALGVPGSKKPASIPSIELLVNGNFEGLTAGWTNSGGTFSVNQTAPLEGSSSAHFTPSSTGQTVTSAQYTVPAGLKGAPCSAEIYYTSAEATNFITLQAIDGSSNVLGSASLTLASSAQWARVPFLCPSSGSVALQLKSTGAASVLNFDLAHLGMMGLQNVSQASYYGGAISTGNCNFGNSATGGFANLSSSGCTLNTLGNAASAGSDDSVLFNNMPAGDYLINYQGTCARANASTNSIYFAVWDGVSSNRGSVQVVSNGATGSVYVPCTVSAHYTYSSTASRTFYLQAYGSASDSIIFSPYSGAEYMSVYRYPSAAQLAVSSELVPGSWSGYQTISSGWTTSSGTYADFSAGSGIVTTTAASRNITCSSAGTSAGISCTLQRAGMYQVCSYPVIGPTGATPIAIRMVDGSGTVINAGVAQNLSASTYGTFAMCGTYNATSVASAITFKIQGYSSSTIGFASSPANSWTVVDLDAAMPTPILVNSVQSSNSAGLEVVNRVQVAHCTSTPCTITSQSGNWVSTVSRTSAGSYVVNVNSGIYSVAPTCTFATFDGTGSDLIAGNGTPSTTSIPVATYTTGASYTDTANGFSVICMGPH
jgi:hypothetical protein